MELFQISSFILNLSPNLHRDGVFWKMKIVIYRYFFPFLALTAEDVSIEEMEFMNPKFQWVLNNELEIKSIFGYAHNSYVFYDSMARKWKDLSRQMGFIRMWNSCGRNTSEILQCGITKILRYGKSFFSTYMYCLLDRSEEEK